jgi:hypothetical protein
MKAPYVRKPEYLSPSSLKQVERDPVAFYLARCGPEEARPPKEQQIIQMCVGTAFDAFVKEAIGKELQIPCPPLEELLKGIEEPSLRKDAMEIGGVLFKNYEKLGCLAALIKEGVREVDLKPERTVVPGTARQLLGREMGGVPIFGYPDALLVMSDGTRVVLDWKTTTSGSPAPGYLRRFHSQNPMMRYEAPHERHGEPLESLSQDWADQLATYSWLLRDHVGLGESFKPCHAAIDQVVYKLSEDKKTVIQVQVAQYRTFISGPHQVELRERYKRAWDAIQEELLVQDPELIRLLNSDPLMARMMR